MGMHRRDQPRDARNLLDGEERHADHHQSLIRRQRRSAGQDGALTGMNPVSSGVPRIRFHQILPFDSWYQEKPISRAVGSRITARVFGASIQAPSVSNSVS